MMNLLRCITLNTYTICNFRCLKKPHRVQKDESGCNDMRLDDVLSYNAHCFHRSFWHLLVRGRRRRCDEGVVHCDLMSTAIVTHTGETACLNTAWYSGNHTNHSSSFFFLHSPNFLHHLTVFVFKMLYLLPNIL